MRTPTPTAPDVVFVATATGYLVIDGRTVLGYVTPAPHHPRVWNAYADLARQVLVGQRSTRKLAAAALTRHNLSPDRASVSG